MAASKPQTRPDSVPALDLAHIDEDPAENVLQNPVKTEPHLNTPDSRSTVSWGTGLSTPYHVSAQNLKFGSTIHKPCTHIGHKDGRPIKTTKEEKLHHHFSNKAYPSAIKAKGEREKEDMEKKQPQVQHSVNHKKVVRMQKSPRQSEANEPHTVQEENNSKSAYWYLDEDMKDKQERPEVVDDSPTIDDLAHMQADYTAQSYTDLHSARKYAAEDDLAAKQKEQVMEQVLIDLLSRHVISDPDQDRDPARANPADPLRHQPGVPMQPVRFKSRRLHDTKVSTVGAVTEKSLQSRVTFSARILTQNGRDALRDLFGFFFLQDHTVTVYEFRTFGKNNFKALPFITRGEYQHQNGRRKGKNITSNDIQLGRNLSFLTSKQRHIPDSIKRNKSITIRICGLQDSESSGYDGFSTDDRSLDTDARRERQDREVMQKIQAIIRKKLSSRSVSVLMGLGQLFRSMDKSGDGVLSKDELADALEQFGISIPNEDFDSVWRVVDENSDGAIDYGEFMRAFIGEMNEVRKRVVRKVFKKLDPHKSGCASLLDMKKLYSAKKHPLVTSGQLTQEEMEIRFIDSFSRAAILNPGKVSYVEFEEYYEGLSIVISSDNDFSNVMRNCWGV